MASVQVPPLRLVSEAAREKETLTYANFIATGFKINNTGAPLPPNELQTSPDAALTAFAQLAVCRTNTSRSLISIFDQQFQYIVAEATAAMPLSPCLPHESRSEHLWLCGTAIPRAHGVCEYIARGCDEDGLNHDISDCGTPDLPLTKIPDLGAVPRFASRPYSQPGSPAKFFAAAPIRTRRGINIGSICVIHAETVDSWSSTHTQVMRDISRIIMNHLEASRDRLFLQRGENMKQGLSSVLEDKGYLSPDSLDDDGVTDEPAVRSFQSSSPPKAPNSDINCAHPTVSASPRTVATGPSLPQVFRIEPHLLRHNLSDDSMIGSGPGKRQNIVDSIVSRAATVIRESFGVDGCLFADPASAAFGSLASPNPGDLSDGPSYASPSSSSENDAEASSSGKSGSHSYCRVLGLSSVEAGGSSAHKVPHNFVSHLLRRHPQGKIFNFDSNGGLVSSDSSDCSAPAEPRIESPTRTCQRQGDERHKRRKAWTLEQQSRVILEIFPNARRVAFMPIRDSKKDKWFAVQFIYTRHPSRRFSARLELNFLRIFGILVMDNIHQLEIMRADKAKSDALSCISHELRSPLHGILLGLELLKETDLGVLQIDIAHTMEICCRTLTDTTDHLLDYAGINLALNKKHPGPLKRRGFQRGANAPTMEDGMTSLSSAIGVQNLVEEVVDSVFAGFHYQYQSVKQLAQRRQSSYDDDAANAALDGLRAAEDMDDAMSLADKTKASRGDPDVFFIVDPTCSWSFHTEGGAIRRIVMNLFGNSLKYTQAGIISVMLSQKDTGSWPGKRTRLVTITVTDTGSGIGRDYLKNHLFRPFTQENSLSPGTGLGLSLVKRIVSNLRGRISVESSEGVGTRTTVTLPLLRHDSVPHSESAAVEDDAKEFEDIAAQLSGLRVRILGFDRRICREMGEEAEQLDSLSIIRMMCTKWLRLQVIDEDDESRFLPDLVLMSADVLPKYNDERLLSRWPTVVVCGNALLAFQQAARHQSTKRRDGLLEFISQPIGPRKLGRILRLVFDRWKDVQEYTVEDSGTDGDSSSQSQWLDTDTLATSPLTDTSSSKIALQFPAFIETEKENDFFPVPAKHKRPRLLRDASVLSAQTRFLLVDDNYINLKMLETYMTKLKRPYRSASNGEEAVNAYKDEPGRYKCILMDISMPVMDGLEATRHIRQFERARKLEPSTIFALTGLASEETQQEAFASGVDLFLTKPVKLKDLGLILTSRGIIDQNPVNHTSSHAYTAKISADALKSTVS